MSEHVSKLIPRRVARERLGGVSVMTLWRLENDAESGFPVPVTINGRVFYPDDEFQAWLTSRPRRQREVA